jgi:hypothetical protein
VVKGQLKLKSEEMGRRNMFLEVVACGLAMWAEPVDNGILTSSWCICESLERHGC